MDTFKLSDDTISHIAQMLQLALITQTDITQLMRAMTLEKSELDDHKLKLNQEYLTNFEKEIKDLVAKAEKAMQSQKEI